MFIVYNTRDEEIGRFDTFEKAVDLFLESNAARLAHYPEPVSIAEIASRLGVKKDTVNKWRQRGLLPVPTFELAVGPVWEWAYVKRWAESTGRLKATGPDSA